MSAALSRVFVCHASAEKDLARSLARRLEHFRFQVWLDEEELLAGEELPDRLRHALDDCSHLLAIVTPRWLESKWTHMELEIFAEREADRARQVLGLLPQALARDQLPALLRERTLIEAMHYTEDELDWRLYCAVTAEPPGPRERWPLRVRQVRQSAAGIVDFSTSELLAVAQRAVGAEAVTQVLAANAAIHCVRIGLSPRWLEVACTPETDFCTVYHGALRRASDEERPGLWARLASVCAARGERPEAIAERELVELLITSRHEAEGLAAVRLLGLGPLAPRTVRALQRWIDPDTEADGPQPAIRPQSRGYFDLIDGLLDLLLEQIGVEPLGLFRGMGSALIGEAAWWELYYGKLLALAARERLPWDKVVGRLHEGLQWAAEDIEQLVAICRVVGQLEALPIGMESVCQHALDLLRFRRGDPWSGFTLRLGELVLRRSPRAVFLRLSATLPDLREWRDALRTAHCIGLSAQEEQDLLELLGRFQREADPEQKALLFESALESPADIEDLASAQERLSRDNPVTFAWARAALVLHHVPDVRRLQAALEAEDWTSRAPAFLASRPAEERALWPYVLGREYYYSADGDPAQRWRGLQRCFRLHAGEVARRAQDYLDDAELGAIGALCPQTPLAEVLASWDQALRSLLGLGRELTQWAIKLQSQLRWLQTALREAVKSSPSRGKLRLLDSRLDAWFAAVPDVARPLMAHPTRCYRHALSHEAVFVALRLLLEDEEVRLALRERILPLIDEDPEAADKPLAAMAELACADEARSVWHLLLVSERLLLWIAQLLGRHSMPGGDAVLWTLLGRSHAVVAPGVNAGELESAVIDALAQAYRDSPAALRASLAAIPLDIETRARVVFAAYRGDAESWEHDVIAELRSIQEEPVLDPLLAEGIELFRGQARSVDAQRLFRTVLSAARDGDVLVAAAEAILSGPATPDDKVKVLELALRESHLRPRLNQILDRSLASR